MCRGSRTRSTASNDSSGSAVAVGDESPAPVGRSSVSETQSSLRQDPRAWLQQGGSPGSENQRCKEEDIEGSGPHQMGSSQKASSQDWLFTFRSLGELTQAYSHHRTGLDHHDQWDDHSTYSRQRPAAKHGKRRHMHMAPCHVEEDANASSLVGTSTPGPRRWGNPFLKQASACTSKAGPQSCIGVLMRFFPKKGFGFLAGGRDIDEDVFLHFTDVIGGTSEDLLVGVKVRYNLEADPRSGKPRARHAVILDSVVSGDGGYVPRESPSWLSPTSPFSAHVSSAEEPVPRQHEQLGAERADSAYSREELLTAFISLRASATGLGPKTVAVGTVYMPWEEDRWDNASAGDDDAQEDPRLNDEGLLQAMEARLSKESGADAKNDETFGKGAGGWTFEEALEANEKLLNEARKQLPEMEPKKATETAPPVSDSPCEALKKSSPAGWLACASSFSAQKYLEQAASASSRAPVSRIVGEPACLEDCLAVGHGLRTDAPSFEMPATDWAKVVDSVCSELSSMQQHCAEPALHHNALPTSLDVPAQFGAFHVPYSMGWEAECYDHFPAELGHANICDSSYTPWGSMVWPENVGVFGG